MVRAGKGRDSLGMADLTGDDVAHEQSAAQLDTLSETEHGKRIGYEGRAVAGNAAQERRRHGEDGRIRTCKCLIM